ncbi:hypothetical protein C8Q76DRAFT_714515 [Earliella scabrosa]|nr:hypothetical protein C8Q76DRAFT_714515 [Earliella scabrosa]
MALALFSLIIVSTGPAADGPWLHPCTSHPSAPARPSPPLSHTHTSSQTCLRAHTSTAALSTSLDLRSPFCAFALARLPRKFPGLPHSQPNWITTIRSRANVERTSPSPSPSPSPYACPP